MTSLHYFTLPTLISPLCLRAKVSRFLSPLLAFLLALSAVNGQETLFAFVEYSTAGKYEPTPITGYKKEVAQSVFNDLIQARGDRYKAIPKLVMNDGRRYMAWMNPVAVEIGMEERIYDVCVSFGQDSLAAMAAILAHELTHYYENHDWSRNFVNQNQHLEATEKVSAMDEGIKYETQADYLGGLLAIAAGYDAYALMPIFLDRAYAAYGLPAEVPGYPSLKERMQLSQNTADELKKIHAIYHTANLLTMIDAYDVALTYYEKVLNTFQSYEVYNNAGVCALLSTLELMTPEEFPYALPLELDAKSRLDKLASRLPGDTEAARALLLQKARNYLVNATNLTEKEPVAALNMAMYHLLAKEYFDAEYWATKAQRAAIRLREPKVSGDAMIVQGILSALQGRPDEAEQLFINAQAKSRAMAELNSAILNGQRTAQYQGTPSDIGQEQVGDVPMEDLLYNLPVLDVNTEVNQGTFCGKEEYKDHTLYLHFANDGEEYAAFQQTKTNYAQATKGRIKLGATQLEVMEKYGLPNKMLNLREGTGLRYDKQKIIFYFDNADLLQSWIVYEQQNL